MGTCAISGLLSRLGVGIVFSLQAQQFFVLVERPIGPRATQHDLKETILVGVVSESVDDAGRVVDHVPRSELAFNGLPVGLPNDCRLAA